MTLALNNGSIDHLFVDDLRDKKEKQMNSNVCTTKSFFLSKIKKRSFEFSRRDGIRIADEEIMK